MAISGIVQYTINSGFLPDILLLTQAPILVRFDGTIILHMAATTYMCMAVTLQCVCVLSFHLFWTSSSLDVPAGVTQEESHTGFPIHLPFAVHAFIFLARKIQPFLSLVDHEVEFFVLTI